MALTFQNIFREEERPRTVPVAYCYSEKCCTSTFGNKPAKLDVKINVDFCPRCGHALTWKREVIAATKKKTKH